MAVGLSDGLDPHVGVDERDAGVRGRPVADAATGSVAPGLRVAAADPDAVFAASDAMAIGALRTLRERGLRVPGDIAVIGFNDLASARHTSPPLTTVHQPVRALGQERARMLVSAIEGNRPSR
ncbi:substrate-binding domain-containing protein [Streptomyces sp. NPDC060028]|uniref:substrate-binding domain-containing protein n=1 Tax=Streptomyces sp. NPDC060028 TaxID=3347041 RepID=UPI0036B9FA25